MTALARVNPGHAVAYGYDEVSEAASEGFQALLGGEVEVYFVFNGTAANVVGLDPMRRPWESVICTTISHINTDECAAPERHLGGKLYGVATTDGKLTPDLIRQAHAEGIVADEHRSRPGVVSITESTELGTLYTPDEVQAIADATHELDMYLHMDGARISNAAASLGVELRALTTDCGVDVMSFGGTKNGLMAADAVVFFRRELARDAKYIRKQHMQLASKMRFLAAQFEALLTDDLWRINAAHANAMALRLADGIADVAGAKVVHPVQANAVFAIFPEEAVAALEREFHFYRGFESVDDCRLMCSWDTPEDDVDHFIARVAEVVPASL
jgi:threonine aldolase